MEIFYFILVWRELKSKNLKNNLFFLYTSNKFVVQNNPIMRLRLIFHKTVNKKNWKSKNFKIIVFSAINRSSHPFLQLCCKKGALRNFTKFTGKRLRQSLFFNKVAGLKPAALLRKRLWRRCFPVNFVKFQRTSFLQNTSGRLLLK